MRPAINLFLAVILATVVAALLAPQLYLLLPAICPTCARIWPYSRVFDRVLLLCVFLILFIFRRSLNLHLVILLWRARPRSSPLLLGVICTLLYSGLALLISCALGLFVWAPKPSAIVLVKLLKIIPAAFIIAIIEETLFRGVIFAQLRSRLSLFAAAIISSFLYPTVHFLSPPNHSNL